ncbi:Rad52/Rad22 family DNA repair protein [Gordonia sp. QH-12]|uniref:Rad52/Rad22 family DNA repair protein n=1 Tax=Gordonia sp. QH-12 TaxID=1437876 RepID=UPI0007865FBC|nr:Rad52/Rad22 family DNA repair protein [Gordonia sp. QH-12]
MSRLTEQQIKQLLQPINPKRVLRDGKGHSHVSQQDILAHLTRVFGFGSFDIDVREVAMVFEIPRMSGDGKPSNRYDVCYRALVRLTVRTPDGDTLCRLDNGSTATAQNQTLGDAHDLAYKSAISLSVKRCAIALGDQFGLSLYNKGQMTPLVMGTLVHSPEDAPADVQEGVAQQVSLGNDEIDREVDS